MVSIAALVVALTGWAAPAEAQQSPCGGHHTVRVGDTLAEIAQRCGITIPALLAANPGIRDNEDLEAGGTVAIPPAGMRQPSPEEACGGFYTIRSGDTVAEVAQKCGLTVPLLMAANGPLPVPLGLAAGSKIRIPPLPRAVVEDTTMFVAAADTVVSGGEPVVAPPELVRLVGVLERGERCMVVRTGDGVVGLLGGLRRMFRAGDEVVVLGAPGEGGACGLERAVEPRIVWKGEP